MEKLRIDFVVLDADVLIDVGRSEKFGTSILTDQNGTFGCSTFLILRDVPSMVVPCDLCCHV